MSDPDREVIEDWEMGDRKMAPRWTFYVGKDGKILEIDKSVKAGTHGADIAAKLAELGVDKK